MRTNFKKDLADDAVSAGSWMIIAGIAFLVSRTVIFGGFAPFGVSFTAAFSGKRSILPAYAGVILGHLLFSSRTDPIKYIAAATMIFAVDQLLKRYMKTDNVFFSVVSLILALGTTGLIFLISDGAEAIKTISFISELMLGAFTCVMFRMVVIEKKAYESDEYGEKRMICIFSLIAIALAAIPGIGFGGDAISFGRIAGMALVMLAANRSGIYGGIITGLIIGLTMDITNVSAPVYTAAYAAAGLAAGLPGNKSKVANIVAFVGAELAVTLFISETGVSARLATEIAAAVILFAALPKSFGTKLCSLRLINEDKYGDRLRRQLSFKLTEMATAYSELAKNVSEDTCPSEPDKFNPFIDAYKLLCVECENRTNCWKDNLEQTQAALSRAQIPALARGRAEPADFGIEFTLKCKNIALFCANVTDSLRRYRNSKRRIAEKIESKKLLSKQYEQLSEILDISAEELSENMLFEKDTEVKIKRAMKEKGIACEVLVYRDRNGMLCLELCGQDISSLSCNITAMTGELSALAGCRLSKPEQITGNGICCFSFKQDPNFTCEIGASAEKRKNENISGDCGTYFIGKDGCTYIILCDGMGSGKQAHNDAKNALELLESFIKAGIDARYAANIVKSALEIREDECKFATIDITVINPVTSQALMIKCGAAPTYIRRRCAGEFLINAYAQDFTQCGQTGEAYVKTVKLCEGDMVIMVSDGVDMSGEDRIMNILKKINSDVPRELCDILLRTVKNEKISDDRTIIAILYEKVLQEV